MIDNSFTEFTTTEPRGAVAYPFYDPAGDENYDWWLDHSVPNEPPQTATKETGDSPKTPNVPLDAKILQVGSESKSRPEKFQMYVMYKPSRVNTGAWVALARLDWEWGAAATNNKRPDPNNPGEFIIDGDLPANWVLEAFSGLTPPTPYPSPYTPADKDDYFPEWHGRSMEIIDAGWNP